MASLGEEKTEFGRVSKNGQISQKSADLIHHSSNKRNSKIP